MGKAANCGELAASTQSKPLVRIWRSPFPTSEILLRTMWHVPALDWPDHSQGMLNTSARKPSARNPGLEPFARRRFPDLLSWVERERWLYMPLISDQEWCSSILASAASCQVFTHPAPFRKASSNCCLKTSLDGWLGWCLNISWPILRCWRGREA